MATKIKKVSRVLIVAFYILAGFNHFRDPGFYLPLIPDYFPYLEFINIAAGVIEILLGIGFAIQKPRKISAYLTITMLVAFIPSHWHFIELGGCVSDGLCVPDWVAWVRLIVIHPLLILWAYSNRK